MKEAYESQFGCTSCGLDRPINFPNFWAVNPAREAGLVPALKPVEHPTAGRAPYKTGLRRREIHVVPPLCVRSFTRSVGSDNPLVSLPSALTK